MKHLFRSATMLATTILVATTAVHAAGTVEVNFVKPENFSDVRDHAYSREQNLKALEKLLVEVATPYVADGQTLAVDVTDVDLAGQPLPGDPLERRVMRGGVDWPRVTLSWTLKGAGSDLRQGEAVVQDMTYLDRITRVGANSRLAYERRMLEAWFREQFGKAIVKG